MLCAVAFHIKWNVFQNQTHIILWVSIRPVLPVVVSGKILQVLTLWLGSSVPQWKTWKILLFSPSSLTCCSRLFLELFQGVDTHGFLLAGTNNSSESFHHLRWFWGSYQNSSYSEFTDLIFFVIMSQCHEQQIHWVLFPGNIYAVYRDHNIACKHREMKRKIGWNL